MPAKPVTLGGMHFARKGDALLYLKQMLGKYDIGDKVNNEDTKVLLEALALHPESKEKIGCGIKGFSVRSADFGSKCFWANRTDGSTVKFSYKSCV